MEMDAKEAAALLGKMGGSKRSDAKTRAARQNGKLGGRPRRIETRTAPIPETPGPAPTVKCGTRAPLVLTTTEEKR
jgi:hypothetical protein